MADHPYLFALLGGALIGGAAGALMLTSGRIAGISGILGGVLRPRRGDFAWRAAFVAGLLAGGALLRLLLPQAFPSALGTSTVAVAGAGLLVGFGTRLGSGCTSGHGVCGLARLSRRSLAATLTFLVVGAVTVWVVH